MASREATNALLTDRPIEPERAVPAAVSLSGVTRVFGVAPALVRVDLTVERGETLLIRGPNGAGKSTLLKVIATALSPTYGTGQVFGFDLLRRRDEIRKRVELVGHRTRLYEDLTAEENLRFVCTLYDLDPSAVPAAVERVGLAGTAHERVRGFSQGMRQRVAVARAILRSADLLLLDEPYAGLDAEAKEIVDQAVVEAAGAGHTVVLATHDQTRGGMAGRTIHMEGGRVLSHAGPR